MFQTFPKEQFEGMKNGVGQMQMVNNDFYLQRPSIPSARVRDNVLFGRLSFVVEVLHASPPERGQSRPDQPAFAGSDGRDEDFLASC